VAAQAQEDGVIALFHQAFSRVNAGIGFNFHPGSGDIIDFLLQDIAGRRYSGIPSKSMPPALAAASKTVT